MFIICDTILNHTINHGGIVLKKKIMEHFQGLYLKNLGIRIMMENVNLKKPHYRFKDV